MARGYGKLTALQVTRISKRGLYNDGGGLYLQVGETKRDEHGIEHAGPKSWLFRYKVNGKDRWHGLGPVHTISLTQARDKASDARRLRLEGLDPIATKRAVRAAAQLEAAKAITFDKAAEAYIKAHEAGWKSAKHGAQWTATLKAYASPGFGSLPVALVDTGLVMKALEPIWKMKPETAARVRGRIEAILDWAKVRGYRTGENPARWKGHLDHLLPARGKVQKVEHHAALPYGEIGTFVANLRTRAAIAARALELLIYTACRTSEILKVRWEEIDLGNRVWTIPGERMKAGLEHRVPLSDPALEVLRSMRKEDSDANEGLVFPGQKRGKPLSNMAMLTLLGRMGRGDLTAHGFRSTFRDWAAERTNFPREVAEAALAHTVGNKVEAAYRRGDLFDKRRQLMGAWAKFCRTSAASIDTNKVIAMRGHGE